MEQLDLTAPVAASGGTALWKVRTLHFHYDDGDSANSFVRVRVVGENGEVRVFSYAGATAHTLQQGLNTANLPVKSLQRRVLERLVADGHLGAGTYSGAPD